MTSSEWQFYKPVVWLFCVVLAIAGTIGACVFSDVEAAERRIPIRDERVIDRKIEQEKQRLEQAPKQAHVTYYMRVAELKEGRSQLERQRKRAAFQRWQEKRQGPRFRERVKASPELRQKIKERIAERRGRNR